MSAADDASSGPIHHALLDALGVTHAFGVSSTGDRLHVLRPRQVHGSSIAVVWARSGKPAILDREEADAVVSCAGAGGSGTAAVGIVTADCVPILAATPDGGAVVAIHAGWRGLASGIVEAGITALAGQSGAADGLIAVVGPHIRICCYEVDPAVTEPLRDRFGAAAVARATVASRPGHTRLSLAELVALDLARAGVGSAGRGSIDRCTFCDPRRFASYRRDGGRAGRMLHYIRPAIRPAGGP